MGDRIEKRRLSRTVFVSSQLIVVYILIECALWSPDTAARNHWALVAALTVLAFVLIDRPSIRRLGLGLPNAFGATVVLIVSVTGAFVLILAVNELGGQIDPSATLANLSRSFGYVIWAAIQELLLQSFFFTRCEDLFGSSTAVWAAAILFAAAHFPSPYLTTFSLAAGLFFCEMFRRYRSVYPLALAHAILGLAVAVAMPDSLMHHMRAGIGYLQY